MMHGSDGLSEIVRNVWARKPPAPSMTEKSECDSVSGSISANTTRDSRWQNAENRDSGSIKRVSKGGVIVCLLGYKPTMLLGIVVG